TRSGEGERQRRRDRDRAPARDERRAPRRHARPRAPAPRRPLRARDALRRRRPGAGGAVRAGGVSLAEDYVLLGLRLGRHVDGLVDAYYGPPELKEQAVADAAALAADADTLLGRLEDGWLYDQVYGLRTYAGVLAGEQLSYSDEVEGCYGVRPQRVGTEQYEAVHDRLEGLLPGNGDLAARYEAWRESRIVPAEKVVPALRDVLSVLRERTAQVVSLPAGEGAVVEEVRDEPWWAFNYYLGELRSRVVVNLDQPDLADDVVELAAHEVYPGHHTEHCVKEQLLIRDRGELEESIQLVPTPAAFLQEGVAETGPAVVLDAALMIHEDGSSDDEVQAYLERWGLVPPEQARHTIRFVTDPTWRAYV